MNQLTRLFCLFGWIVLADGCQKTPVRNTTAHNSGEKISPDLGSKRRQGVDFTAKGSTSTWALDIDFAKAIRFQAPNGAVLTATVPKSQRAPNGNGILLDAQLVTEPSGTRRMTSRSVAANRSDGRLKVVISPVACRDSRTGKAHAYEVSVEAHGQRYSGCGTFLNGTTRLNSQWVLETYRGQRLHAEQFVNRQMPTLAIDLKEKRLAGFTGCNAMQGQVKAEGDNLRFEAISTTRRACPYNFESGFLAALQSVTLYRISNNRLTLLADGKYVMSFRKTVRKESRETGVSGP
ncbi:hypothetical protein GCM10027347_22880 [Larkinella harenae]